MAAIVPSSVTFADLYRVLFRHKWKTLIFFFGVFTAVTLVTFFSAKVYRSESELFVRLGRENVTLDPVATLGHESAVAVPASRENEINSLVEVLQNRTLMERVVDAVGPTVILSGESKAGGAAASNLLRELKSRLSKMIAPRIDDRERAMLALTEELYIEPIKKSNILRVSYDSPSPEVAQKVVSSLVGFFLEQHIQLNRTQGAHEFLAEQTDYYQKQLTAAEQRLCAIQNRTGLSLPDAQRQLLVSRVGAMEDQWRQARVDLEASTAEMRALEEKLRSLPPMQVSSRTTGTGDHGTDLMRQQRYALDLAGHQRNAIYTELHPKLQEIRAQLPPAVATLSKEPKDREQVVSSPNRAYEEVQLALLRQLPTHSSLAARAKALETELAQANGQVQKFNADSLEVARLQREIDVQMGQWRRYATTLEQARMDASMGTSKISNISIVQPASYSLQPVRPRIKVNLLLGLIAATLGALGLALTAEYLDHSFKSVEDVERALDLPALTSIPLWNPRRMSLNGKGLRTQKASI